MSMKNRLLCELATHKDFIKFLADIEIYVDGIATTSRISGVIINSHLKS